LNEERVSIERYRSTNVTTQHNCFRATSLLNFLIDFSFPGKIDKVLISLPILVIRGKKYRAPPHETKLASSLVLATFLTQSSWLVICLNLYEP